MSHQLNSELLRARGESPLPSCPLNDIKVNRSVGVEADCAGADERFAGKAS